MLARPAAAPWMHYAWVAGRVEICTRVQILSWAHHREVAPLTSAKQKDWLAKAVANGWSVRELRAAIKRCGEIFLTEIKRSDNPTRLEVGISKERSSRVQKLAAVPAEVFEAKMAEVR